MSQIAVPAPAIERQGPFTRALPYRLDAPTGDDTKARIPISGAATVDCRRAGWIRGRETEIEIERLQAVLRDWLLLSQGMGCTPGLLHQGRAEVPGGVGVPAEMTMHRFDPIAPPAAPTQRLG